MSVYEIFFAWGGGGGGGGTTERDEHNLKIEMMQFSRKLCVREIDRNRYHS